MRGLVSGVGGRVEGTTGGGRLSVPCSRSSGKVLEEYTLLADVGATGC